MSEEVAQAAGDIAYWRTRAAHLTARLGAAEAEAAALRAALEQLIAHGIGHLLLPEDADRVQLALDASAGATLLAQWGAARDLAAWLNDERHWTCGNCPCCGFGRKLDGSEFHGTGCVLDAYNRTCNLHKPAALEGGRP